MSQIIKKFDVFIKEGSYTQEWPMNKQEIGVSQDDLADTEYYKHENKFQEVQEHMKLILKPMLLKKNPNANDQDIDKVSNSFFNLGAEKAAEVKKMVDNCKDTKQCAQEIVNKYYKYVKINFGTKDNINNVEQDSVMSSERIKYLFNNTPSINEGKIENVQVFPNFIRYNSEDWPGYNIPKRYIGKKPFKWRVLAKYGNKVKPINFGNVLKKEKPLSIFQKKYWDNLPTYK